MLKENRKNLEEHLPIGKGPGRDELLRLYTMSEDEAWNNFDLDAWIKKYRHNPIDPQEFFYQWTAAQGLKSCYDKYLGGDKDAIIEGLKLSIQHGLGVPRWLSKAFLQAYQKVKGFKSGSWDDVFGKPHRPGTHLAARADAEKNRISVYAIIRAIKKKTPETPIDEKLFESVGKKLGISKTLANKFYYEAKKEYNPLK